MKKIPWIVVIASLLYTATVSAQTLWMGTKYNMSINEVRSTIPQLAAIKPETTTVKGESVQQLRLNNVQIEKNLFTAILIFHQDKLKEITLMLDGASSYQTTLKAFEALTQVLRKKYGKEISYSENNGLINQVKAEWLFQGTLITLSKVSVSNDNVELKLDYQVKAI